MDNYLQAENGRIRSGADQGVPEVLPYRLLGQAVREANQEDHSGPGRGQKMASSSPVSYIVLQVRKTT